MRKSKVISTKNQIHEINVLNEKFPLLKKYALLDQILSDKNNPRFAGKIINKKDQISEIECTKDFSDLLENIKLNGGINNPILVQEMENGLYLIRDGFRRYIAYIKLAEWSNDYKKMPVYVLPKGMTEHQILVHLRTIHGPFQSNWGAYESAKQTLKIIEESKKNNLSEEEIQSILGINSSTIKIIINTLNIVENYLEQTGTKDPKWSQWYEAVKAAPNKLCEMFEKDEEMKNEVFQLVKDGAFVNPHESRKILEFMKCGWIALRYLKKHGYKSAKDKFLKKNKIRLGSEDIENKFKDLNSFINKNKEQVISSCSLNSKELERTVLLIAECYHSAGRHETMQEIYDSIT